VTAQADVVTAQAAKTTACTADVAIPTVGLNEMETLLGTCTLIQGFIQGDAVYIAVKAACATATATLTAAQADVASATSGVTAAQAALAAAVAEAARLMDECLCRVSNEQAAAWTAATGASSTHVTAWKKAHEIICALDAATTCTVPTCPGVTQPTLAAGVAEETCVESIPAGSPPYTPETLADGTTVDWAGLSWIVNGANNVITADYLSVQGLYQNGGSYVTSVDDFSVPLTVQITERMAVDAREECLGLQVFPQGSITHASGYTIGMGWWANKIGINVGGTSHNSYGSAGIQTEWHTTKVVVTQTNVEYYYDGILKHTIGAPAITTGKLRFASCADGYFKDLVITQ
jgi:hypothetical protein